MLPSKPHPIFRCKEGSITLPYPLLVTLVLAVTIFGLAACGAADPAPTDLPTAYKSGVLTHYPAPVDPSVTSTPKPTLTPTPNLVQGVLTHYPAPTRTVVRTSPTLRLTRAYVQDSFEQAGFRFDTFGTHVGGTFYDGTGSGIQLDIYGPPHNIEAVELTFLPSGPINQELHDEAVGLAIVLLVGTVMPEWLAGGPQWIADRVSRNGTDTTYIGDKSVTLYSRPNLVVVSMEGR